ncbi:hypothetical protein J4526_03525 [Desulfurococcaceae archaeon MEX13E-LK6-19]|nr:hypothetical protein J4526_03525 [Desulfurococcaceae archaeon MEX13E-LK6-19]
MINVIEYYSQKNVAEEITLFLKDRWVGIEGPGKKWIRWIHNKPLIITSPDEIVDLLKKNRWLNPRSIYGTIELFKRLTSRRDVEEDYENNVYAATMFIDIDIVDESIVEKTWRYAIEAAKTIRSFLEQEGVRESIYFLWSGAGIHVRIHEKAISDNIYNMAHPIDVVFALAEYIMESLKRELLEIVRDSGGLIKIENLVAPKRVFTAPLSLHRRLDAVAIPLRPEDLDEFNPSWSNPKEPKYSSKAWARFKQGEADDLAVKALKKIGKVKTRSLIEARATKITLPSIHETLSNLATLSSTGRSIGRFPVMALLQAARYYLLKKDIDKAKSFGLNRAIFYAWAKYYGPSRRPVMKTTRTYITSGAGEKKIVEELGERVQIGPSGYYMMGGIEQKPEDYDRNVARRFEEAGIPYEKAWKAALEYVSKFPRTILTDPQKFYKYVYEPVRDNFVEKVLSEKKGKPSKARSLDDWLKKN